MNILGIDPGADGALAVITPERRYVIVHAFKGKPPGDILQIVQEEALESCRAFIERVHAFPKQGVTSAFTFGYGAGMLEGFLLAERIPFEFVEPKAWQKELGLGGKYPSKPERKKAHLACARRLYPHERLSLAIADALLIAEYGYRREVKS